MLEKNLQDFKDGTYDALLYGIRSETNKSYYYKQGYDFGLVLFADQIDQEPKTMITLRRLKNAITDIKEDFHEGNDSHSCAEYRGACESLDMLFRHFEELEKEEVHHD